MHTLISQKINDRATQQNMRHYVNKQNLHDHAKQNKIHDYDINYRHAKRQKSQAACAKKGKKHHQPACTKKITK